MDYIVQMRSKILWGPPNLLSNGYQGQALSPWGENGWGVKLTTHLHLLPRSRMRGAITPLPQYRLHGTVIS
jgi:hypothetical protein